MEKLVYVLWKPESVSVEAFRDSLIGEVGRELIDQGARELAVSVADEHVQYAQGSVITQMSAPISAIASLWLDSHLDRAPYEKALERVSDRLAGYLVLESRPIVNRKQRAPTGQRTPGINTIAFLEKPDDLEYETWREIWQGSHTGIAIETQSTFLYIQNVVVRALTPDAPPWVAIVEEGFPGEALTDQHVFYASGGSEEVLDRNRGRMVESCQRFIEFDHLESHMFSEYILLE